MNSSVKTKVFLVFLIIGLLSSFIQCSKPDKNKVIISKNDGYTVNTIKYAAEGYSISWIFSKPGENQCKPFLMEKLNSADKIKFASYSPTDPDIASILEKKKSRGYYDKNYCKKCRFNYKGIKGINMAKDPESKNGSRYEMHHKFALIEKDGSKPVVISGSYNWDKTSTQYNYEDMIMTDNHIIYSTFNMEFLCMGNTKNPSPLTGVGDRINIAFNQGCHELLIPFIRQARESLYIALYTLKTPEKGKAERLYDEVMKAYKRGVRIRILVDGNEAENLDLQGIPTVKVKHDSGLLHHKFMVIDRKFVATGTFNYGHKALTGNYETMFLIDEPLMAKSYIEYWESIYEKFK